MEDGLQLFLASNTRRAWQQINAALVRRVRKRHGRREQPSVAVIDSRSVKTLEGGEQRGVDVYKQTAGPSVTWW